jgi:hypothetical protein
MVNIRNSYSIYELNYWFTIGKRTIIDGVRGLFRVTIE